MASTNDNTTQEFDDVELYGGCVASKKAVAEMLKLAIEHKLNFVFAPGRGEFTGDGGFRCQISTCDDVYDLAELRAALKSRGLT